MSLFKKFLISYMLILIIPVLLLGMYGFYRTQDLVTDQVMGGHQERLQQAQEYIDSQIIEIRSIAENISNNTHLTPYMLKNNLLQAYHAKSYLNFQLQNPLLQEVVLYYHGGQYMYSSVSTYTKEQFIQEVYPFEQWSKEAFLTDLEKQTHPFIRPAEYVRNTNQDRIITYGIPIPNHIKPYGIVLFLINEEKLSALWSRELASSGLMLVFGEQGQLLNPFGVGNLLELDVLNQIKEDQGGLEQSKINGLDTNYFISSIVSDKTGWKYVALIPENDVVQPIRQNERKWMFSLLLLLACGGLLIYVVMHFNYHPIKSLLKHLEALFPYQDGKNEFEKIRKTLEMMKQQNVELDHKYKDNLGALKEQFLFSLLRGEYSQYDNVKQKGTELGILFHNENLCVVVIECEGMDRELIQKLVLAIEHSVPTSMETYIIRHIHEMHISMIVCTEEEHEDQVHRWMSDMQQQLNHQYDIRVFIAVGGFYNHPNELKQSYLEAKRALEYKLIKGWNEIIYYDEVPHHSEEFLQYPNLQLENLMSYIQQANMEMVQETLSKIKDTITQTNSSIFIARCVCFDLINESIS